MASWLAGVAMSTTSVAVVYAVMLEFGFNATNYGKVVLAACFVTDLGTVLALGLIFAPFTIKTLIFVGACVAILIFLPWITAQFFRLMEAVPQNSKRNTCCSYCSGWADLRVGQRSDSGSFTRGHLRERISIENLLPNLAAAHRIWTLHQVCPNTRNQFLKHNFSISARHNRAYA
jgi:hypothetical protein